jgi:hypothetical protein
MVHYAQLINGIHFYYSCSGNAINKNELKIVKVFRNAVSDVEVRVMRR